MNKLIHHFSIKTLTDFFRKSVTAFRPQTEDISRYIENKHFDRFSQLERIGNLPFQNSDELIVFACQYNGNLSERSSKKQQFEIAKLVLQQDLKDAAIFVFYDETGKFRFSFVRRNWGERADQKYSTWKRFTYFVDPKEPNKTFRERLTNCTFADLDSIQDAFSVEKLTNEFYNDLKRWYDRTLLPETGISFPSDSTEKPEETIIRLITRLLFVWFIKQKNLVPNDLFDTKELSEKILKDFDPNSTTNGNYYNAILQNLFFATLNKAVTEREFATGQNRDIKTRYRYAEMFSLTETEILQLFAKIPFLNGGLFECLDREENTHGEKYHLDGFSRNTEKVKGKFKHRAFIPNAVFFDENEENPGLIPLLKRYNFTVEENVPNEIQVALDPELLGNVFENLLGSFNPETQETARKQSGSFYTPKEIVSFMVDESLIAFLCHSLPNIDKKTIRKLFDTEKLPDSLEKDSDLRKNIYKKLKNVKILDPACGSGAFPMGMLNRMMSVLEKLDTENSESLYDRKLHLIQECIYGVDVQKIAAQIAKLRFFISLVVEQEPTSDNPEDNYGIPTLPNLETKFVTANTLIGIKKQEAPTLFTDPRIDETKSELMAVREQHFYAKSVHKKKDLREKDAKLRTELLQLLQNNREFAPEDAKQFAQWNPYDQNAVAPFFDPFWMFGIDNGFDIVVGNPPYIQLQKDNGKLAKQYEKQGYETFAKTGDIYSLFYERGWQLLQNGGLLCYITSNKWMRAGYGEKTRQFFTEKTDPMLLVDFAGQKVFDSATVDTNILLFAKDKNRQQTRACTVKEKTLNKLGDYLRQNATKTRFNGTESWTILSEIQQRIKRKVEKLGKPLKDWDISIYRGVLTGYNEAFVIDRAKRDELLEKSPKNAEIIRPILRGRDIKRYGYQFAELWLINAHNGVKEKGIKRIEIDDYPDIKEHLDKYFPQLEKRSDKGDTPYNLRNCAYTEEFFRQKILYSEIVQQPQFYLDRDGAFFAEATTFIMTGQDLEYLYHLLHTRAVTYFFRTFYAGGGLGNGYRYKKAFLENLPIPPKPENIVINEENAEESVYELYGLSAEEVEFIQSECG